MKFVSRRVLLRVRIHNVETTLHPRKIRPDVVRAEITTRGALSNPLRRLTSRRNRLPHVGVKNLVVGIAPVEAHDCTPRVILVVTFVVRILGTAPA